MKIILKIIQFLAITLVVIFLLLAGLTLVLQGRITRIFSNEINRYSETGITVEKVGFSLIRGFPKATVELKNLKVEAHPSTDLWIDSLMAGQSFVDAEFVYASFNIRDIIHKEYFIDRLTLRNSSILLFKDDNGSTLKRILKEEFRNDSSKVSFDLDNIRLENSGFRYLSSKSRFSIDCTVDNASGKLSHSGDKTTVQLNTSFDLKNISSYGRNILKPLEEGDIDGELIITPDSIYFKQLELFIDNQQFSVTGSIYQKRRNMALGVSTANIELARIQDIFMLNKELKQELTLNKLEAELRLDFDKVTESFSVRAKSFELNFASSVYSGNAYLKNLENPFIDLRLNSDIDLGEMTSVFSAGQVEKADGKMHLNAMIQGRPGGLKDISRDDILKLRRRFNFHLTDVSVKLKNYNYPLENISGNIMLADNAWADELSFSVAGQNIVLNSIISNPEGLLNINAETIDIKAGIWADKLEVLKEKGNRKKEKVDKPPPGTRHTEPLINRINASVSISLDSLVIDKFRASQFSGALHYRPGMINISSFNLLALSGSLDGNAALIESSEGDYQARTWIDIGKVDIHQAFKVFNNFKQDQIVAENLKGDLSGSLSISTMLDSSFKLLPSSLYVTGSYSIFDGELIAFEPIRKVSRFIEVSELENIVFDDLHNDLLISDSRILIPSMEINSSAFNISLSGEQDFSGDFEYHLSVLLSDILSKKARSSGSYISEFGEVEDDGLGRTTLFIKLEKDGKEARVSYDVKKLREEIKESLKEEKQTLKTILNDEYGWYNADSLKNTAVTNKRVFRITWEEADSVKTVLPGERGRKTGRKGIFNKIFKSDTSKKKL